MADHQSEAMTYWQEGPSRQPISPTTDDATFPLLMIACSGVTTYDSCKNVVSDIHFPFINIEALGYNTIIFGA